MVPNLGFFLTLERGKKRERERERTPESWLGEDVGLREFSLKAVYCYRLRSLLGTDMEKAKRGQALCCAQLHGLAHFHAIAGSHIKHIRVV